MGAFPYSLQKTFIGSASTPAVAATFPLTSNTWDLTPGQIGLFDKKTNVVITTANISPYPYAYLAQGSYYLVDSIGKTPLQGMKESLKTPGINAKYVSKFYSVTSQLARQHIVEVGSDSVTLNFESNQTYNLRIEAKGSVPLRVLQRQMYKVVSYFTGCESSDCLTGCSKEYVDPSAVMYGWAQIINTDPLLSLFVTAQTYKVSAATTYTNSAVDSIISVTSATGIVVGQLVQGVGISYNTTVVSISGTDITISLPTLIETTATAITFSTVVNASSTFAPNQSAVFTTKSFMILAAAYSDTVFGNCSFNPLDFYQVEPIILGVSLLDKVGNVCAITPKINSNNYITGTVNGMAVAPVNTSELQSPKQVEGIGETVIREYLLSREYEGVHFSTNPRYREVEQDPVFTAVDRTAPYTRYYIEFYVPIGANPSNTFSTQQYSYCIALKTSDVVANANFVALITQWLSANGSFITAVDQIPHQP